MPGPESISLRLKPLLTVWSEGFSLPTSLLLAPVPFVVWFPIELIGSYCATLPLRSLLCAVRLQLSSLSFVLSGVQYASPPFDFIQQPSYTGDRASTPTELLY
jgi:hypothetical protein